MFLETKKYNAFTDVSFWTLVFSNLAVLFLAVSQHWEARTVVFTFWLQVAIIGFFNAIKLFILNDEAYADLIKDSLVKNVRFQKFSSAVFFCLHFGFFLFCALILSMMVTRTDKLVYLTPEFLKNIFVATAIFFANYLFSFMFDFKKIQQAAYTTIFLGPYVRVLPILLMFFVAPLFLTLNRILWAEKLLLPLLFLLKTLIDASSHVIYNKLEWAWSSKKSWLGK